ncbi:restriction endonuclease subunit S [Stutzerimonas kirkiae]|uniref:restriction endonuclease subunit S n=1 Tax=Stutzerimonas kirkiae TaxID=2211392 RepID=UPI0010383AA3|nr:restriction endonuclease subunit S [Stutzerimonas kirkiae]TBV09506.1 restriction endonuclease subunit S [Stutzerimonas kirkiae]
MSSEWPRFTVSQLQAEKKLLVEDGNHGEYRPRPDEFQDHGVSFIRAADMSDGRVLFNSAQCISKLARSRIRKGIGLPGDVLLSHKGTVGKVAYVPEECPDFVCSPQTTFWRVLDEQTLNRSFLFAYLQSAEFKAQLASRKGETDMADYVSLTAQRQLQIPVPSISIQRAIGKTFSALNDRITLLRETSATLEATAQALFKSWFVDFAPVRAQAEGRQPEGMNVTAAALFPDSFEESELGLVPKGWGITSVAEVAEVVKGKSYTSKELAEAHDTALVTLKSFARGGGFRLDGFKPYTGSYKPTQVVVPGDLIIAYTDVTQAAELIGKPAIVIGVKDYQTLVASLDVGVVRPDSKKVSRQYLYGLFRTDSFQSHTFAHTSGTTVLHLAKDGVGSYRFSCPPNEIIQYFSVITDVLSERCQNNIDQVRTLTQLRDTLLPRLISGQLCLPDAEQAVEKELA